MRTYLKLKPNVTYKISGPEFGKQPNRTDIRQSFRWLESSEKVMSKSQSAYRFIGRPFGRHFDGGASGSSLECPRNTHLQQRLAYNPEFTERNQQFLFRW